MKKQSAITANITNGLDVSLDPVFLANESSPNLSCVRFDKGLVLKDVGRRAFGTGNLTDPVLFMDMFPMRDGSLHYLFGTTKQLFKLLANQTFEVISDANYTGNATDRFTATVTLDANGSDLYIITNGVDVPKKWLGANSTANLGGLANIASAARLVSTFKNRCILGFTTEGGQQQPTRIRWSATGNPEEWANANLGCGFVEVIDSVDWITAFLLYKERFLIFKERSIWELLYSGNVANPFTPVRLMDGVGTLSSDFPISLGDSIIFYGTDGIYSYDTYTLTPLADKIYPLLYYTDEGIVNIEKIATARAAYIEELGEYWLSIPTSGSTPDTVLKLNIDKKSWTKRNQEITAFGYYSIAPGVAWQDGVGTWANQTGPWMVDKSTSGAPTTLMGTSNGYIWEDNRLTASNETMIYETKDFKWTHAQRIVEIRVQAKYGPFDVSYSIDGGLTWSDIQSFDYVSEFTEFVMYCNITTKMLRIKITSTANWCEVKWIEPWYIPRQRTIEMSIS